LDSSDLSWAKFIVEGKPIVSIFESFNCFTIYMVHYFESKIVSTVIWVKIEISFESILLGGGEDMKSNCNV